MGGGKIMEDVLGWFASYWLNWVCGIIAAGVALFAKHYVKLQKQALDEKWKEKEKNMCGKIITTLEEEIQKVETRSREEDVKLHAELDHIHSEVDTMESGILSIQGK